MDTLKYAYGYVRVSTDKQEELSPDSQKKLLQDYAVKNGIVLLEIFRELGVSGRHADKRPEFQRMIGMAKSQEHPVDAILVWKFSRFARNQEESIVYKSLLKKKHHVDVISVSEPLVEGPFGSLIERIIEWMDEYYSIRLSGEVFRGMSEKARRGGFQARPPLGYRILHKNECPVVVPEEAEIVRTIFRLYVDDLLSPFDIARHLNALGLVTGKQKPFEKRSIEYILDNPAYIGKNRWNRTESGSKRIKDEDEWIVSDGPQEPIIAQDIFQAAQERRQKEYRPKGARPASTCRHWLSGLLKCSACGRTLSASSHADPKSGTRYIYFQCYGYLKGKCSVSHNISEKKITPIVLESMEAALQSGIIVFEQKKNVKDSDMNQRTLLELQISKLDQRSERLRAAYLDGIDTLEEYKVNRQMLDNERVRLSEKLAAIQKTPGETVSPKKMLERIKDVRDILDSNEYSMQEKNAAIKTIIEKIVFFKAENRIQVFYYYN